MYGGRRLTIANKSHDKEGWVVYYDDVFPDPKIPKMEEQTGRSAVCAAAKMIIKMKEANLI